MATANTANLTKKINGVSLMALVFGLLFLAMPNPVFAKYWNGRSLHVKQDSLKFSTQEENKTPAVPLADIKLDYYGGPVMEKTKIVSVYWTKNVDPAIQSRLKDFYTALMTGTYFEWLSEYNTDIPSVTGKPGTNQKIKADSFVGDFVIEPKRTGTVIDDLELQAELVEQIEKGVLPENTPDTLYMVHFPPGVSITITADNGDVATSCKEFCGYHGAAVTSKKTPVLYAAMPDFSGRCDVGCGKETTKFDNFTAAAAHEVVESVTNPYVSFVTDYDFPLAWYHKTLGEIGDICVARNGRIANAKGETFVVQAEWSNTRKACYAPEVKPAVANPSSSDLTSGDKTSGDATGAATASGDKSPAKP